MKAGKTEVDAPINRLEQIAKDKAVGEKKGEEWEDWISTETWGLFDRQATTKHRISKRDAKGLANQIRESIKKDRKRRVEKAGEAIEADLANNDPKEAFGKLKRWYRMVTERPLKPTREDTEELQRERRELYSKAENLPPMFEVVEVDFQVEDGIPQEKEVAEAVTRLRNGKSPGPSGITAEQLKRWWR